MTESCLIFSPPSSNEGMPGDSDMGVSGMVPVCEVASVPDRPPDKSLSKRLAVDTDAKKNDAKHSRTVTESDNSDTDMKGAPASSAVESESEVLDGVNKWKMETSFRSIQGGDEGKPGPSEGSVDKSVSLPLHEQINPVEPLDISYSATPQSLRLTGVLMQRLGVALNTGRIQVIDLSRRGLVEADAALISAALRSNPQLAVLKLGYNDLGDNGSSIIASSCSKIGRHHARLTILDLGFNNIGDQGCTELSLHMVAGNHTLRNLFLSGNKIRKKGAMALAGAILHGCSLAKVHLSANKLGPSGLKVLSGAVAELDARRQHLLQRQGGIVITAIKPQAIEHLLLDNTFLGSTGLVSLSGMLMSNQNLSVLGLSNNGIDDRDMAVLSQALSQNKSIPLAAIDLSFNKITCIGVECFMNAVWGSKTLREIKLDNNRMQDRGAQLCSVVLGAIPLAVLDIGFNRVSTVGIKALMKSVSENDSLRVMSMSGMPMDLNACKAVSYALAYNQSLERFHIDSCCVGYSGQRHIVAGIVSNRNIKLRAFTGFPLAQITKTLGLPQIPEDWGNDRALSFVRYMWMYARMQLGSQTTSRGPAPPTAVAASGKTAFAALSASDVCKMQFQQEHMSTQVEDALVISPDAAILVRSESGHNLQIPVWGDDLLDEEDSWSDSDSFDRSSISEVSVNRPTSVSVVEPERRNKNLRWLRVHIQSLTELGSLGFNNADLWQLHQYFFSPAYIVAEEGEGVGSSHIVDECRQSKDGESPNADTPTCPLSRITMQTSFNADAASTECVDDRITAVASSDVDSTTRSKKRGVLEETLHDTDEPSAKRAKNLRPRIAYFPRIREKLESLGTKPSVQTLSLLRQLKYIESVMLQGKNVYADESDDIYREGPHASDVEMILLDLL